MIYDWECVRFVSCAVWCHFEMETPLGEAAFLCILTQFTCSMKYEHTHSRHINNVYERMEAPCGVCEKKPFSSEFGTKR